MRRFNTAGPCRPAYNYMILPERRMPEAVGLVDHQAYFALHAPRQTGANAEAREEITRGTVGAGAAAAAAAAAADGVTASDVGARDAAELALLRAW
jgi:hypothetical protein